MQKLNWREIYVLVLIGIITAILGYSAFRELTADFSSLRSTPEGSVSITKDELISNSSTVLQAIVSLAAFIFFLLRKQIGWILAMPILSFYALLLSYLTILAGDNVWAALPFLLVFLAGVVFLFFPSTLTKFKIKRGRAISVVAVMMLLVTAYLLFY